LISLSSINTTLVIESYPEIQKLTSKLPENTRYIFKKNLSNLEDVFSNHNIKLLIINSKQIPLSISDIKAFYPSLKILVITTKDISHLNFVDEHIDKSKFRSKCLNCKIRKLLSINNENLLEIYSKGNLYLNPETKILYFSEKYIHLTTNETNIIKYLLEKETFCSLNELKMIFGNRIKEKCITVLISRLRKKLRYTFGYTIIKNSYGKGYYIEI